MAKRAVGWPQAALTVVGFALTLGFGIRLAIWFFKNTGAIFGDQGDPIQIMTETWFAARWALLGIALFGISWLWSLLTNAAILQSAKSEAAPEKPPMLK